MADESRIAILSSDKCKPEECRQESKKSCPVVKTESFKLPLHLRQLSYHKSYALGVVFASRNVRYRLFKLSICQETLDKDTTHRYGPNTFKLNRLPVPRAGQDLGLLGKNGIGKSTALKVLAGKLKPNLGRFHNPPDWQEILTYFRGSELQNYFTGIL